jgi:hypothetical protein
MIARPLNRPEGFACVAEEQRTFRHDDLIACLIARDQRFIQNRYEVVANPIAAGVQRLL